MKQMLIGCSKSRDCNAGTRHLFPDHRLGLGAQFVSFLDQGAEGTEQMHQAVTAKPAINSFLFPDLPPNLGTGPYSNGSQNCEESVQAARLSNFLGGLSSG